MAKKTYRVVGDSVVAGTSKGDTFTAAFTDEQEAALVEGGHIKPVDTRTAEKKKEEG